MAVFFSGLVSDARSFHLHLFGDSFVNPASNTLTIHFEPKAEFYEIIFAYVIYPRVHPIFTIVQDSTPEDDGSYQIAGISHFHPTDVVYREFRIENRFIFCEGEQCPQSCILTENCEPQGGHLYQGKCYFCPDGFTFQAGVCRSPCKENEVWFMNRICVCKDGYILVGTSCVPQCGSNQIWVTDRCICVEGSSAYGDDCRICPPNSQPNADKTSCVCDWPIEIFLPDQNVCHECPAKFIPNAARTACECIPFHI